MAGNVQELYWDSYDTHSSDPQTDPRSPATPSTRVFRGGSWGDYAIYCRTANRVNVNPGAGYHNAGFRCVLPAGQ